MIDNRIMFEERYDSDEYGTTTLYFIAPKEMLKTFIPNEEYADAVSMEISVEFPTDHIEGRYGDVSVSPTKELGFGTEDYDWHDVRLPYEEIDELIKLADEI